MKTNIVTLHLPEDFDTSLLPRNLPKDTLYAMESVGNEDLTDPEKMAEVGKTQGVAMYRAFRKREVDLENNEVR